MAARRRDSRAVRLRRLHRLPNAPPAPTMFVPHGVERRPRPQRHGPIDASKDAQRTDPAARRTDHRTAGRINQRTGITIPVATHRRRRLTRSTSTGSKHSSRCHRANGDQSWTAYDVHRSARPLPASSKALTGSLRSAPSAPGTSTCLDCRGVELLGWPATPRTPGSASFAISHHNGEPPRS